MRFDRIDQLEKFILDNKSATLDSLCEQFDISKNTIRRDIESLVEKGTIEKVYGGVRAVEKSIAAGLKTFSERNSINMSLKENIATKMVEFINEKDTIFIDTGSSTLPIIDMLDKFNELTIVTNSVPIIYGALSHPNLNVIALPGTLNRSTDSLVGAVCLESLNNFHLKKAIMACTGLTIERGVCNASFSEYEIKKTAMHICDEKFLLADHTKFGASAMMTYADVSAFDTIITDEAPIASFESRLKEKGVRIVY